MTARRHLVDLLSPAARERARQRRVPAGVAIVSEGDPGETAFIVRSGVCEVSIHGEMVNVVREGEFFGDMACLDGGTRAATVRAVTETEVLEIDAATLRAELSQSPALLGEFLRAVTCRARGMSLREADARGEQRELGLVLEALHPALERFRSHPAISLDVQSRPVSVVSGDYYDVLELSPAHILFAVGDVMGHGAPTAPIYGMVRGQLRALATAATPPGALLAHLHEHMRRHGHPGIFMTMALLRLDLVASAAEFAMAGPPAPLVYTGGRCIPLSEAPGWTLGYPVDEPAYRTERIPIMHGMRFLLFTDGLSEAVSGPDPERHTFGTSRLLSLFQRLCEHDAEPLAGTLFAAVDQFRAGWPQEDDATALVVTVR